MPLFDNSTVVFSKKPPKSTYQSYMCSSKCEYSNKDASIENPVDKPSWISQQSSMTQDKQLQQNISKLRDILSDTIASITRENNLKKGESVELTLEIELVKSKENTPTHSLVEVTIIQHNNKGKSNNRLNKLPNKMLFKIEQDKPLESEPLLHKRQSWFKRVMSKENNVCKPIRESSNKGDEQEQAMSQKQLHKPLFCPTANQRIKELNNSKLQDTRSKFRNILPKETNHSENNSKGYQKVKKREKRQETVDTTCTAHGIPEKLNKKNSLMKKISDVFLPSKKPSKKEVVETTLTALKNEIDNMKTMTDEKEKHKHNQKRDKTQVQNLGKLVNNVLFDVMASIDGEDENTTKEELKLPLQYQSFFEPVTKTNKKRKKLLKRKTSPSVKTLYRSHSDTCCVIPLKTEIKARVKSSNSIGDFGSYMGIKLPSEVSKDINKQMQKKKRKRSKQTGCKKNMKGEKKIIRNTSTEEENTTHIACQSEQLSRKSLIQWNGQYVRVSKDIKARIEMLIINELENLALREGMECDITPLSSTDNTLKDSNKVEKMSSFICELDISDKSVRKIMKSSKSLHRKVSIHPIEEVNTDKNKHQHKGRTHTTLASSGVHIVQILKKQTQSIKNNDNVHDTSVNINEVNPHHITNKERNPALAFACDGKQDGVEIKYMNKNMQNWSAESQTTTLYSPDMITSNQQSTRYECVGYTSKGKRSNRFISTGFVKIIQSDDSTWNKCFPHSDIVMCERLTMAENLPESNTAGQSSSETGKSSSKTSNEIDSSIEIELDIQDLEYILREAKNNYNANKVLIEAKCVHPVKKQKSLKPAVKTCPSYTNQLLTSAAKKLEKYANTKSKNKKSK